MARQVRDAEISSSSARLLTPTVVDAGKQARDPFQRRAANHPAVGDRSNRLAMSRESGRQEKLTPQPFGD